MIAHGVPGLDIRQDYDFQAPPGAVFSALTTEIGRWWPARLRLLGTGQMQLRPELGAFLQETAAGGRGAVWGQVDLIEPERRLYLNGWFGVPGVVMGRVHFDIEPQGGGATLSLTHRAIGPVPEDRVARQRTAWRDVLGEALRVHLNGTLA